MPQLVERAALGLQIIASNAGSEHLNCDRENAEARFYSNQRQTL